MTVVLFVVMLVVGLPPLAALVCILIYVLSVVCADLASLSVDTWSPRLD